MLRFILAAFLVVAIVSDVDARPRRRVFNRRQTRTYNTGTYYSNNSSTGTTYSGGPQAVAEAKASLSASRGVMAHFGGGYGGANAEGVGFSTYSPQDALNNCCFTGQRSVAGSSVVRGANGWYAVKLYW